MGRTRTPTHHPTSQHTQIQGPRPQTHLELVAPSCTWSISTNGKYSMGLRRPYMRPVCMRRVVRACVAYSLVCTTGRSN